MTAGILIIGDGLLAEYVCQNLAVCYSIVRQSKLELVPDNVELAVVLNDAWDPSIHQLAEEQFRRAGIPWLRGFVSLGEGIIGPLVRCDKPGCSLCADKRRLLAGTDRIEMWKLQMNLAAGAAVQQDAWVTRTGLLQMAVLICHEVQKVMTGEPSFLEERIFITNLRTFINSSHFFLPDPMCPVCSQLPEDTPDLAQITLKSSPKVNGSGYRCRSIDELKMALADDYLDFRTGIMNGKMEDYRLPFADVLVNMPLFGADEGVAGRSLSYETSELTAILEGLERHCGVEPQGKKRKVCGSYHNLQAFALHPERVGVHNLEQYAKPGFPFKPFDPNRPIQWVWGYSFLQERPILVPELLAYYSLGAGEGFVYETSNGCAVGGSLEEAIFHGIMEVIERDSFLITWYARLPLPRLDPRSANDKELQLMVDRLREAAGYDVFFYNSTMEHGIPSVWALAKNRGSEGVNLICAAGASIDPVRAAKSSIYELAGMMVRHDRILDENRHKYEEMLNDSFAVRNMEDHGLLYGLPEAEERLGFLLDDDRPLRTFAEEFPPLPEHADLKDDLEDILKKLCQLGLEVIVVDQTTSMLKRNGLFCVKVLIPGMLPMTFGHHLTRTKGLKRVLEVPMKLGYSNQTLSYAQLNPYPHPFP